MRLLWVVCLLLAARVAVAEPGVSYLGLCSESWNCADVLKTWEGQRRIVTGWLERSFAPGCACADKILSSSKPKVVRIHLINSPCLRNRRCEKHDYFAGMTVAEARNAVATRDRKFFSRFGRVVRRLKRRLGRARGTLSCYVSPCLECDLGPERSVLLRILSRRMPECVPVDSVWNQPCLRGYTCEKHGPAPSLRKPCIADMDGDDAFEIDIEQFRRKTAHCDLQFLWRPWMNCIKDGPFIPPSRRQCYQPGRVMREIGEITWEYLSAR